MSHAPSTCLLALSQCVVNAVFIVEGARERYGDRLAWDLV